MPDAWSIGRFSLMALIIAASMALAESGSHAKRSYYGCTAAGRPEHYEG